MKQQTPINLSILFLAVLLCFGSTISFDFTNWDDGWSVKNNYMIRSLSPQSLGRMFNPLFPRYAFGGEYLPLRDLSHAIDYKLFGLRPGFYHGENVLIYGLMVLVFYLVLLRLIGSPLGAFWGSLIFALHPLHCESVCWISARKDVLSGLFFLLALERYLCFIQKKKAYGLALFFYLLACLSKYTAFALPPLLIAMELYVRPGIPAKNFWKTIKNTLPFWLITLPMVGLAFYIGRAHSIVPIKSLGLQDRLWTMSVVVVEYIQSLVLPLSLSPLYLVEKRGISPLPIAAFLLLIGLILGGIITLFRRKSWPALCGLTFFICLAPVANLVPSPVMKADRYLLLPSMGYAFFLGWLCFRLVKKYPKKAQIIQFFFLLLALFYGTLSFRQAGVWKNSQTLWSAVLIHNPRSNIGLTNLAIYHFRQGQIQQGESLLHKALQNNGKDKNVHFTWGIFEIRRGRWKQALLAFDLSIQYGNTSSAVYSNRGEVLLQLGHPKAARQAFLKALAKYGYDESAQLGLARTFLLEKNNLRARFYLKPLLSSSNPKIRQQTLSLWKRGE